MAGAGGNVTGGMGNFVQNASVAYLQELGANQVKQIADALDSDTARAALHAVVGCAGAAASSQSCASGALGAAGGSIINNLLDQINKDKLTPEEREARANLVSSLIAGITAAAGGSAVTATNAARIETENNRLATSAEVKRIHQLSQGDPRKEARLTAAACALLHCEREYPEGSEAYNFYKRLSDAGNSSELAEERLLLQSQKGFQFRAGLITGLTLEPLFQYNLISDNLADAAKRVDNTYQLGTRTLGGVQAVGGAATAIAGGTITAGGAASCGPTAGAGCLAAAGGVALSFWGLDQAKAGVATMISGQPQATVGGIVLQQVFGISPQAAELLYGVAGGVGGIAADAALARQAGAVVAKSGAADTNVVKTGPVQELEVGSYQNLKAREVVGDGLEHDHIPSYAALRTAKEAELGRPLTEAEAKTLYQNATAVEVRRDVHVAGPTYGGKNTATQIQQDAANLCGAVCRDTDALRNNLLVRGYDPKVVDETIKQIIDRNRATGVIK